MRYVQRDPKTNNVMAHFANEQTYAKEMLPDDHKDIVAYRAARAAERDAPAAVRVNASVLKSGYARGLTRVLAKQFGLTEKQMIDLIKKEADAPFDSGGKDAWEMEGLNKAGTF